MAALAHKSLNLMSPLQPIVLLLMLGLSASAEPVSNPPGGDAKYFRSDGGVARSTNSLPDNLEAAEAQLWRSPLDAGHSTPIL